MSLLKQFVFAISGSYTDVERLVSVSSPEKGNMMIKNLEEILNIKVDSDKNSEQYFNSIKNNKRLLQ